MIAYVIGTVTEIFDDAIVVEQNGMGFNIRVPSGYDFQIGNEYKVYTYTSVREDAFWLFGFQSRDTLTLFKQLIGVNGIGPKGALSLLSVMRADDLRFAIYSQDSAAIAKAPGIGKKTAERVILDLKDKVKLEEIGASPDGESGGSAAKAAHLQDFAQKDAVDALTALGYGTYDAAKAVSMVKAAEGASTEEILKEALKYLL